MDDKEYTKKHKILEEKWQRAIELLKEKYISSNNKIQIGWYV